jgi:SagB-type dehydrogenase family enzyme
MRQLRHDLNYGISAGLLVAAIVAIMTGIIAHLWDLNDFIYHTYSGYVMTLLALAHVWLNWKRMISYARHRLRPNARRTPQLPVPMPQSNNAPPTRMQPTRHTILSRRGFLGLTVGSLSGYLVGRGLRRPPTIAGGADLGVVYHQWSKPGVIDALGTVAHWGGQPPLYKSYPDADAITLPTPTAEGGLEEAISRRRSTRDYSGETMTLDELSRVLFYSAGINADRWGHQLRTAPSSGALYPLEIYAVVHNVDGLSPGVYHYHVQNHGLERLQAADLRSDVVQQGLMQAFLGECNVVLILTVIFQRMRWKYQDRTYRYGLIEAGHVGQNVYLAATSIGLGACAVGAFMDDQINTMLGVDGTEEAAIYMLAVGKT